MPFLYENPLTYSKRVVDLDDDLSGYRWTVDTPNDLDIVRQLIDVVGAEPFDWVQFLDAARANPSITQMNADIQQKQFTESDSRWHGQTKADDSSILPVTLARVRWWQTDSWRSRAC